MIPDYVKRMRKSQRDAWAGKLDDDVNIKPLVRENGRRLVIVGNIVTATSRGEDGWTWTFDPRTGKQSRARQYA